MSLSVPPRFASPLGLATEADPSTITQAVTANSPDHNLARTARY
jgi:hypothetical protein